MADFQMRERSQGFPDSSPTLADNTVIKREAAGVNLAGGDRSGQRAIGFAVVAAVAEAALAKVGAEFAEGEFDFLAVEVAEAEFLQAGRVDQLAFGVEVVERGVRGGVFAGVERR